MLKLIKEKFDLKDPDVRLKYLSGLQEVKLENRQVISPAVEFLRGIVGNENIMTDDFSCKFSCGKFMLSF
jgi:hypothetical protein